jgi:ketol-acid reductoisomerase
VYVPDRNANVRQRRSLSFNSQKNYREEFKKETDAIAAQEIWRAGQTVRKLRVRSLCSPCTLY